MQSNLMTSALCGFAGATLALVVGRSSGAQPQETQPERLVLRGAGESRVVIGYQDEAGATPGIWLYDEGGTLRAEFFYAAGVEDEEHELCALQFFGEDPAPVVGLRSSLYSHHGRTSALEMRRDGEENSIVKLGAQWLGPHLELGSRDSTERILMYTGPRNGDEREAVLRMLSGESALGLGLTDSGVYANAWAPEESGVHAGLTSGAAPTLEWRQSGELKAQARFED